ncbi:hypothetical protein BBK36DRAFT_66216 [Trichoderma citrinoviride]|uniref:Oxidase ustYa n=1 Tax=Trichoderma citrinoviride TaxID=58853 RepID=A0A2T4B8W9_9HYPO|nr:hypothetical protein BBK36DRAFT_66216 [Trichoderma citrinoviride]PTB65659.1 hypothetical protein BBK36DRAFT_66216 [Trichoderma citrinoviride]
MRSSKHEHDEEEEGQAFLPASVEEGQYCLPSDVPGPFPGKQSQAQRAWRYLRLLIELAMAGVIVLLLMLKPYCARDTIRRTPVPRLPQKLYTFRDNPRYMRGEMWFNSSDTLHTLHNWIELSSASRGYVVIGDDAGPYDLPEPYTVAVDRQNDGPAYMMSVFHQLHCLSYIAEHYQQGYGGVNLTEEVAHHSAHCFNYLRQGIMCSADTTLEGQTKEGPGEGSVHECADYDALLEWANEHAAMKWREGLLPGESTL